MRTRLFIENQEVELNSSTSFPLTKTFEDLSDPTAIISDWSKTISIPFTESNNKLFGHIYKPDRAVVDGSSNVGIYFDPTKKLNFRLEYMNSIVMVGYAKMASIKQSKNSGSYELNLFGELGKVFKEMKLITFDRTSADSKYIIDGAQYVDGNISKELIANSWTKTQEKLNIIEKYYNVVNPDGTLSKKLNLSYASTDYINFAPNNSFCSEFDYKTYQLGLSKSKTFAETLDSSFAEKTGISGETAIGDGLLPRDIGEFRSYHQLPYIYFNKLFQIFNKKVESVTGYTSILDSNWFNESNPYWKNWVFMLQPFTIDDGSNLKNTYIYDLTNAEVKWTSYNGSYTYATEKELQITPSSTKSVESAERMDFNTGYIELQLNDVVRIEKVALDFCVLGRQGSTNPNLYWNKDNALLINISLEQEDGTRLGGKNIMCYCTATTNATILSLVPQMTLMGGAVCGFADNSTTSTVISGRSEKGWKFSVALNNMTSINSYNNGNCKLRIISNWLYNNANPIGLGTASTIVSLVPTNLVVNAEVKENHKRSYSYFTLNDLWNNEYNVFDQILNYCKIFRIGIFLDERNKQLRYTPFSTYFFSHTIEDWTDKLDKSKDFIIQPVIASNKYLLFNYKDNPTARNEDYKKKYGVNFGELRLNTEYQFNNETKKLFPDTSVGITSTNNVLSWCNLYEENLVLYTVSRNEIFIENKDKDRKAVDVFGQCLFDSGIASFDNTDALNFRNVTVSDDTLLQTSTNKFFYAQDADGIKVGTYPKLSIVKGNKLSLFTKPKENYSFSDLSNTKGIYELFWQDYLNERYSIQNKLVTCYLNLSPSDYINFAFNKFIVIENQLYMVNKIYDYDITSTNSTKVDLITIKNIAAYTTFNL